MSHLRTSTAGLIGILALSAIAEAEQLRLSLATTLDITPLGINSVGDIAYEIGAAKLWICNGSTNGDVHELNPITGAQLSQFDPAIIPGLTSGPDALAIPRTGGSPSVFVFSSFNQSEGGSVTQAGALVADFGTAHGATGADFDLAGNLWIASGTVAGGGSTLMRLNTTTGAILASVPILGTTERVYDLAFDPHTGACYCLLFNGQLLEVNTGTGAQVSSTDLTGFMPGQGGSGAAIGFGQYGQRLFVATSSSQIVVLAREYTTDVCDGTDTFTPCPCGNTGLPGHGCNNSFGTGGARLTAIGVPSVAFDSFQLRVTGLPPSAPCLFFQATTTFESTPLIQGDGMLCITGTIVRLATRTASNGAAGYPSLANDPLLSVRGLIPSFGGTRFYQVWYRNAASFCTPATFNYSQAFQMLWES